MKTRMEPLTIVIVSILLGWGWTQMTNEPICYLIEESNEQEVIRPVKCSDLSE